MLFRNLLVDRQLVLQGNIINRLLYDERERGVRESSLLSEETSAIDDGSVSVCRLGGRMCSVYFHKRALYAVWNRGRSFARAVDRLFSVQGIYERV